MRRVLLVVAAALAVVVGILAPGMAAGRARVKAARAATAAWRVQPSPSPGGTQTRPPCCLPASLLEDVAATSTTNAWAVGFHSSCPRSSPRCGNQVNKTLIEHWNGRTWRVQPSPNSRCARRSPQSNLLYGVAATSATSAWAVGSCGKRSLIEHWNGRRWRIQKSPNLIASELGGVAATSAKNAWAVGDRRRRALIEHWNGRAWKVQPSPTIGRAAGLSGVAATSAKNAWAVGGDTSPSGDLVEHWNGRAWKVQPISTKPINPAGGLGGVAATSRADAWAVSDNTNQVLHWDGRAWKVQAIPPRDQPEQVAATSSDNAWVVGFHANRHSSFSTLVEHWNGKAWKVQPTPNPGGGFNYDFLYGVAATSAKNAWAVGEYTPGRGGPRTLIERWNGNG